MEGSWWRSREDLDEHQEEIIKLPPEGRYLILGPPGCGKTNLLVLRAAYLAKMQYRDSKILAFTSSLVDFIRTGVSAPIDSDQIDTHISWIKSNIRNRIPRERWQELSNISDIDQSRQSFAEEFLKLSEDEEITNLHQAIFVDEVQDLSATEIRAICRASQRITVAGDTKQSIYKGTAIDELAQLGFTTKQLSRHYRIGIAIARVADKLIEPETPQQSLEATSQYDESIMESKAELIELATRQLQFNEIEARLKTQLSAYPKEKLAILVPKNEHVGELQRFFSKSSILEEVVFHTGTGATFFNDSRIHVLTVASAKGTEFRAVHLYACEDVQWPQLSRKFWYTAVTRAKTSLTAYFSPGDKSISKRLVAAFAEKTIPAIDSLFN